MAPGCAVGLQANFATDTGGLDDTGRPARAESGSEATPTEADLTGRMYVIRPADLTLVEPPGLDALLHEALVQDVFVYVGDEATSTLRLQVALAATDGQQDPCQDVRTLPEAHWQNPIFDAGPGELEVSFAGNAAWLRYLTVTGTFDQDGRAWNEGTLSAQLDARELAAALAGEDACEMIANLGGECGLCDDGAKQCVTLEFEDVRAEQSSVAFDPTPSCI